MNIVLKRKYRVATGVYFHTIIKKKMGQSEGWLPFRFNADGRNHSPVIMPPQLSGKEP